MICHIEKFVVSDSKFLAYFLPKKFRGEDSISTTSLSFNTKGLEFEILTFNITGMEQSIYFLNTLENKFCVYENTPFFVYQEFSLFINKLDFSEGNIILEKNRKKLAKNNLVLSYVNEKNKNVPH